MPYDDMPARMDELHNHPFRSWAWAMKQAGGYAKDKAPFSEFRWADFLRGRIPRELVDARFRSRAGTGDEFWLRERMRRHYRAGGAIRNNDRIAPSVSRRLHLRAVAIARFKGEGLK
jgi:Putative ParB-like nuclease